MKRIFKEIEIARFIMFGHSISSARRNNIKEFFKNKNISNWIEINFEAIVDGYSKNLNIEENEDILKPFSQTYTIYSKIFEPGDCKSFIEFLSILAESDGDKNLIEIFV